MLLIGTTSGGDVPELCGLGLGHSTVSNPLHITTDGAAGSPAEATLADRSISSVALRGRKDDPGPCPDA